MRFFYAELKNTQLFFDKDLYNLFVAVKL